MTARQQSSRRSSRIKLLAAIQTQPTASKAALARSSGHCPRTVARWKDRSGSGDDSLRDAARSGRPSKLSQQDIRKAARHLQSAGNPTIASACRLVNPGKDGVDCVSEKTLRRHISKQSVQYGTAVRQNVSAANAAKRLQATTQTAINQIRSKLKRIVLLDAALVRWSPGKGILPYRRGKEWGDPAHPRPQNLQSTTLYHFYSAVTMGPLGKVHRHELIYVPPRKGFTAQYFVDNVAKPVLKWARDDVFQGGEFYFVQDQAKQHIAKHTKLWMQRHEYAVYDHPPQSPDMNRIEKVWALFKTKLVGRRPTTEKGFKKAMRDVWEMLDSQAIASMINDLPSVMKKVHARPEAHVKK